MSLRIYNSLTKQIEDFEPINPDLVSMYACGPTVYYYMTIGNWRTYVFEDFLLRILHANDYQVRHVMNLTDVGHLTGDNLGDADTGDDKLEKAAEREGKSARDIADFYIEDFTQGLKQLNILPPTKYTRATDYIDEQIELVKTLEKKGYTYETSDGIYFDTSKYPKYREFLGQDASTLKEGARVEPNPEKLNPTDFALWKFSPKDEKRWQEWDSPWGVGFPGWHLECSAMAMKELGETIDLHLGGEDHMSIHHPNERAQSECATDKKFVNYWLHGAFLQVDGGRMGKSEGNAYTLADVRDKGFEPMALRYLYTSAHYRAKLNFTWEALQNAQNSLKKLYDLIGSYKEDPDAQPLKTPLGKFMLEVNDDINLPKAVATMWDVLKSDATEAEKLVTVLKMDEILGFGVEEYVGYEIPQNIVDLAETRMQYRQSGIWDKADQIRRQVEGMGYVIVDKSGNTYKIKRNL
ncbi:cysteine--tRNA ligase [bacterium]|nr:cysteine--tRNA ligase [bacterium]